MSGFATGVVEIGSTTLVVAVADTPSARRQGLRGVGDLGDLDGMLFVFEQPAPISFTMQDTLIPLDLLVVSAESLVVARISMVPCREEPCRLYPTGEAAAFAIEVPAGAFSDIAEGARFSIKQARIDADG